MLGKRLIIPLSAGSLWLWKKGFCCRENESLFRWIKSTGRFMPSHSERFHDDMMTNKLEDLLDWEEELDEEE